MKTNILSTRLQCPITVIILVLQKKWAKRPSKHIAFLGLFLAIYFSLFTLSWTNFSQVLPPNPSTKIVFISQQWPPSNEIVWLNLSPPCTQPVSIWHICTFSPLWNILVCLRNTSLSWIPPSSLAALFPSLLHLSHCILLGCVSVFGNLFSN